MSLKKLPEIKAYQAPSGASYEIPSNVFERWEPVKAAHDDDKSTINMYDQIGESWDGLGITSKMVSSVLRKNKGDAITVNINSGGGDFFEGVNIYNMLREHDAAVNINVLSLAGSAASIIAMAADELSIGKSAFLMIHNSWGIVMGNQNDFIEASEMFAKFDSSMANVYSDRTGIKKDEIAAMMDKDTWMTGEESIELGFADSLLESDTVIEDEKKPTSAKRKLDVMFAKEGLSVNERRKLYKEISNTPDAITNDAMPDASATTELKTALGELLTTLRK